jgi:YkoY family integral membrane protein
MLEQTFSLLDIPRLITLIFLEGVLSIDNALAIALIVRGLPEMMRQKALFIGLVSAVALRALGVLSAAYLIELFWVQIVGGGYLLYLSLSHLISSRRRELQVPRRRNFWTTVFLVEMTDFIFAIDSVLAGLALVGVSFSHHSFPPKIWIVYVGGVTGLVMMRFAAKLFIDIMERFPRLEVGAHLIVGWIGLKLILDVSLKGLPSWTEPLFWMGIVLFFAYGFMKRR